MRFDDPLVAAATAGDETARLARKFARECRGRAGALAPDSDDGPSASPPKDDRHSGVPDPGASQD